MRVASPPCRFPCYYGIDFPTPGDLIAEVQIVLPKDLEPATRELLAQIDQRYPQDPRAHLKW
jgi:DnaJ-class molecular chaperone